MSPSSGARSIENTQLPKCCYVGKTTQFQISIILLLQVDGREEVSELLSLEGKIDLVIPRGSGDLVRSIQQQAGGRMPVLGHSEGVCTVYVDTQADLRKALKIGKYICVIPMCCNETCRVLNSII